MAGVAYLTHIVEPGDTLSGIAARYGFALDEIISFNSLKDPNRLKVGQELLLPAAEQLIDAPAYPAPFVLVHVSPLPVQQGSTMAVRVVTEEPVELVGRFEDQTFSFVEGPNGQWGLVGIHPLMETGCHPLTVEATSTEGTAARWQACVWIGGGGYETQRIPLVGKMDDILSDQQAMREENIRVASAFSRTGGVPMWRGSFRWPLAEPLRVTGVFGDRRAYGNGPPSSFHAGIDLSGDVGDRVLAPAMGRVVLAEPLWTRGNGVIVDHGQGVLTGYWHLSEISVEAGQLVLPGTELGRVGSTGLSTGPHLHWEVRVNGVAVQPTQWVEGKVTAWPSWQIATQRARTRDLANNVPEGI
jgi:murein DD-endopeptidase MepM/ murein hydrolase activator NlpD